MNHDRNSIKDWKEYLQRKFLLNTNSIRTFNSTMRRLDNLIASHAPSTKGMIWRNGKVNPNASITDVDTALSILQKLGQANLDDLGDPSDPNRLSGTPLNSMFISQEDSKLDEWTPGNNQNQSQTGSTTPKNTNLSGKKHPEKTPNINERMKALTNLMEISKK
jgi:hypothetical protein